MNQFSTLVLQRPSPGTALLTLNRAAALNAINSSMRKELATVLRQMATDDSVRIVVINGEGRAFSAGADLKDDIEQLDINEVLMNEYKPSFDAIITMNKPVISVVTGLAAGIGLSLALVCDLTVMADDAFLLCPFSTISLIPDGGANFLLARQLGYRRAYQMAIEAERLPATEALRLGLVNRLAPADHALEDALAWADELAQRAPLALARTKEAMRFALGHTYDETYRREAELQAACFASDDFSEGRSAFVEKRAPRFSGK